jgi:polyvinyl alcohol dehydrogenase (cytochrome)
MGAIRKRAPVAALGLLAAIGALALAVRAGAVNLAAAAPGDAADPAVARHGSEIYAQRCASCHDVGAGGAPEKQILTFLAPESIHRALTQGVMRPMAAGLSDEDVKSVAEFLSGKRFSAAPAPKMCAPGASAFDYAEAPPFPNWGLAAGNPHAVPPAVAKLGPDEVRKLEPRWTLAFPNATQARSQPTLGGGAVFVGSHDGTVFALDRATGCARWVFHAGAEVRSGLAITPWRSGDHSARPLLYFGDLVGQVYALDAATGALVWKVRADPHPSTTITGAPSLFEGKLLVSVSSLEEAAAGSPAYACCTFRGSLVAYDAKNGSELWRTYMTDPPKAEGVTVAGAKRLAPSGVAIWSSPTIDPGRRRVYVATGDAYTGPAAPLSDAVVAMDIDSGKIAWSYQATPGDAWNMGCLATDKSNCPENAGLDVDFGTSPILAAGKDGKPYVLAGQKSGMVYGLDAETGRLRWKVRLGRGGPSGGVHFGMSAQDGRLFVPISDDPLPGMPPGNPGLYALDISTGNLLWKFGPDDCAGRPLCRPGFGGTPTAIGGLVLMGGDDGKLRALDSRTGKLVWAFDTAQTFVTVNGERAHGGAISAAAGPVPWDGMIFVASGYGFTAKMPGNLLLAFAPPKPAR